MNTALILKTSQANGEPSRARCLHLVKPETHVGASQNILEKTRRPSLRLVREMLQEGLATPSENSIGNTSIVYSAFGTILAVEDGSDSVTTTPALSTSYGFQGMQNDSESGLIDDQARNYDTITGRFLQRDSDPGKLNNPITHINKYVFAGNNPSNLEDPYGLWFLQLNFGFSGGAGWGFSFIPFSFTFGQNNGKWEFAFTPSFSTGAYAGGGGGLVGTVGFNPTNNINDLTGSSLDIGGSAGPIVFGVDTPTNSNGQLGSPTIYAGGQYCVGTCTVGSIYTFFNQTANFPILKKAPDPTPPNPTPFVPPQSSYPIQVPRTGVEPQWLPFSSDVFIESA